METAGWGSEFESGLRLEGGVEDFREKLIWNKLLLYIEQYIKICHTFLLTLPRQPC